MGVPASASLMVFLVLFVLCSYLPIIAYKEFTSLFAFGETKNFTIQEAINQRFAFNQTDGGMNQKLEEQLHQLLNEMKKVQKAQSEQP